MNAARKRKLYAVLLISSVIGLATLLVLYALRQNISLFYTPSQIVRGESPDNRVIRVGGMVLQKSLIQDKNSLQVQFMITDYQHSVSVIYQGVLPDLFREGSSVVVRGKYNWLEKKFDAIEVLAKHDERYMPREVKQALQQQGKR